jgi:transposase InsO family protein
VIHDLIDGLVRLVTGPVNNGNPAEFSIQVVAINRNAWSQSIGIARRDHPVRALARLHVLYRTRDEAKADVFDYIERFYNPKRRPSTIGYKSPFLPIAWTQSIARSILAVI